MAVSFTSPDLHQEPVDVKTKDEGDLTLWSVTTIIGCLDKPALLYWAAEQTATAAINQCKTWQAMLEEQGEPETVKWLRDARFRSGKNALSAAALGTVVHAACEEYALSGVRPSVERLCELVRGENPKLPMPAVRGEADSARQMVDSFDQFLQDFQPEYIATEVTVYSPTFGYAGTADGFAVIDGMPVILDYKTSRESYDKDGKPKGPYPEVALQLAAYRYAEAAAVWRPRRYEQFRRRYYLLSTDEQAMSVPPPAVDGGVVIHLSPQRYGVYPVRCDESVHEQFLFVLEAARWHFQTSKDAVGAEMAPPAPRADLFAALSEGA